MLPHNGTYDASSRIGSIDSYVDGLTSFAHDNTDQLQTADHTGQTDESYTYDENGNRTMSGYSIGDNNRLLSDGTYNYTYDDEGNRLTRTVIATGYVTAYEWDHRNRLTKVTEKDDLNNVLSSVEFRYDVFNLRVAKIVDADGPGGDDPTETYFSWESNQIALQFDGDQAGDLAHRYLYGPQTDQVLVDEAVSSLAAAGDLLWPLADHLGTLRDLAEYDTGTNTTSIANHIEYDSYGNVTAETNAAVDHLFAFTGRERDDETDLQYHRARYYDPAVGRWIGEDPIGFEGDASNLSRYVSNRPINATDPTGLIAREPISPEELQRMIEEEEERRQWFADLHNSGWWLPGPGMLKLCGPAAKSAGTFAGKLSQKALDHIVKRHWPTSGAQGAGKFAPGTTAKSLLDMIKQGLKSGKCRPNTHGRPGLIFEFDFVAPIGTDGAGNAASRIRIVIGSDGVITAFPY